MDAVADWVTSGGRYALDFDGTNDHVANTTVKSPVGNTPVTAAFWIKWTTAQSGLRIPFGIGSDTGSANGYFIYRNPTGFPVVEFGSGNGAATSAANLPNEQWVHLCGVYSTTTNRLFVNGSQVASVNYSSGNIIGQRLYLGALFAFGNVVDYFTACQLDDVFLHNRALSANEIRTLASRRGIAYELAARRRSALVAGFNRRRRLLVGAHS
jgi:hypothetical protein